MRGLLSPLIKLITFLVVTALATYVLAATITNSSFGAASSYKADFTDVSGLQLGDDVRIAGVRVGTVENIVAKRRAGQPSYAEVTFTVQKSRPLPRSVTVHLRYRNLVGQRYMDVEQGAGTTQLLSSNTPIPMSQTFPAVDLTVLFAGFQPLTEGLDSTQINALSMEVIQTLQGEGGSLQMLLSTVADLTNSLADKDKVIGDVIDNLSSVLGTVAQRDGELSDLIIQLRTFVSGLASDRYTIGNAIDGINSLATSTAGLLTQVRAPLAADVRDITPLLNLINRNKSTLQYVLQQAPPTLAQLVRTASYGSWFNFYLCSVSALSKVKVGGLTFTPTLSELTTDKATLGNNGAARCNS